MEHKFGGEGSFRVFLKDGFVHAALDNIEGMKDYEIPLETDSKVNDGLWHQINVELRENFVNVTVLKAVQMRWCILVGLIFLCT